MQKQNVKLNLQYDGTNYHGWQRQDNANSIQETIEKIISNISKEDVTVVGCSRTDTGVHALNFVCNFITSRLDICSEKWKCALNALLPADIRVINSQFVDIDFNSRFDAISKTYLYKIQNSKVQNPILRNYCCLFRPKLDLKLIKEASQIFVGSHDFLSFTNNDPNRSLMNSVREIYEIKINKIDDIDDILEFTIVGNAFLYKMIRILVGTLLYVGCNKIKIQEIKHILESKDRRFAGFTAPAHGLYLYEVKFDSYK